MKIWNLLAVAVIGGLGLIPGRAQDAGGGGRLSYLSADDKTHLLRVHRQVMADNSGLKTEQDSLTKEREFVKGKGADATAEDKQTLRNNLMAHREKMEAAMLKADPTVGPILDQVKAHMKERYEQRQGAAAGAGDDAGNT